LDAPADYWIDIAVANSLPQIALENASRVLYQHNFDVVRSHLDMISDNENGSVCMLRLLVSPIIEDNLLPMSSTKMEALTHELKRTKWLDPKTMDLVFNRFPWIGITKGEVIMTMCSLLHPIMTKKNQFAYSIGNIHDVITNDRNVKYAALIAEMFLAKFNPNDPLDDMALKEKSQDIVTTICEEVEDTVAKELFLKMIEIVKYTLKTNVYFENRYSLGLRLDPKVMELEEQPRELPYGIMFQHGRRFNAFHVRFRDIARGGMRLVTPSSQEQHALESARQYDECYGLAFAQQLKNKDIPEGGSKAVNLIDCHGLSEEAKQFVMRKSVKAFTNTILDLIVENDETRQKTVDYLGKKEVIYLGPDEQVSFSSF
jgi:glutamate dehydrogenase